MRGLTHAMLADPINAEPLVRLNVMLVAISILGPAFVYGAPFRPGGILRYAVPQVLKVNLYGGITPFKAALQSPLFPGLPIFLPGAGSGYSP
jgi:hypothetical protein